MKLQSIMSAKDHFLSWHGAMLQSVGEETGTRVVFATPSLVAILIPGWLVGAALIGVGVSQKNSRLVSWGMVEVGIMTIITPLVIYLNRAVAAGGTFEASTTDVLFLSLPAALGGGILALGLAQLLQRKPVKPIREKQSP